MEGQYRILNKESRISKFRGRRTGSARRIKSSKDQDEGGDCSLRACVKIRFLVAWASP